MNMFRLLRADEIECRIAQISKSGKGLSLLLYKTARTDANILDETVGPENWENDFKLVDGVLYGGITRLAAAIWKLRHIYGIAILDETIDVPNRYGKTSKVSRYYLP